MSFIVMSVVSLVSTFDSSAQLSVSAGLFQRHDKLKTNTEDQIIALCLLYRNNGYPSESTFKSLKSKPLVLHSILRCIILRTISKGCNISRNFPWGVQVGKFGNILKYSIKTNLTLSRPQMVPLMALCCGHRAQCMQGVWAQQPYINSGFCGQIYASLHTLAIFKFLCINSCLSPYN